MTANNRKSTIITNSDREAASGLPDIMNPLYLNGGKVVSKVGRVAKLGGDGNGSTYRFCRVASSSRISAIKIICDAASGLTAVDVGLLDTLANGGAVVNQNLFATGIDLHAGNTSPIEARYNNLGGTSGEQRVWELLGLSADPGKSYDLTLTATTAGAATAFMVVEVLEVTGMS